MMQEWFRKARLGIFIHYGIYAVGDVSESWSFHNGNISYENYMKQCGGFTASRYDPAAWAELFKKAGAQYVVCLLYTSQINLPFGRSCNENGDSGCVPSELSQMEENYVYNLCLCS